MHVKSLFLGRALWLFPGAYACFCVPSPPLWLLQGLQRRERPAAEVGTWRQAFFAMKQPLVPVQMQIHSCFGMVSIPPPTSTRFLLMILWIVVGILSYLRHCLSRKEPKLELNPPTHPPTCHTMMQNTKTAHTDLAYLPTKNVTKWLYYYGCPPYMVTASSQLSCPSGYLFYAIWLFPKCLTHCLPPFKGNSQEVFSGCTLGSALCLAIDLVSKVRTLLWNRPCFRPQDCPLSYHSYCQR